MGKNGKKKSHQQNRRDRAYYLEQEYPTIESPQEEEEQEDEEENQDDLNSSVSTNDIPSKFSLYQQSVQSPKGDISYLQKFFLTYVGGRVPLHFQEDFCGTALLSTEWLQSDARRTAIGLDLDVEALDWCMENNVNKVGADVSSRIFLFHGNVLQPLEAKLVNAATQSVMQNVSLGDSEDDSPDHKLMKDFQFPARDIVCAFNYSCCCLHTRQELVSYFKHALSALNKKGGIFVMDLYGGTSAEHELRMQRKFPNFTDNSEQCYNEKIFNVDMSILGMLILLCIFVVKFFGMFVLMIHFFHHLLHLNSICSMTQFSQLANRANNSKKEKPLHDLSSSTAITNPSPPTKPYSMCGSKLNSTSLSGKRGSASILICTSHKEKFAMHFPIAGDCGHCLRSKTAWKKLDFSRSISGSDICLTAKKLEARMGLLLDET